MRIVALSDTHIPDFAKALPKPLFSHLRRADLILHAGDVTSATVLDELALYAQVHVAMGNNDGYDVAAWGAEDIAELQLHAKTVVMLHDSGRRDGRARRLRRRFPNANLIVFGHSHIPVDEEVDGLRLFNPGSPTWKRRQPVPTIGLIDLNPERIVTRIVDLSG
ncbi:MAG TPA: metallophosphoesterase family protein [Actinomycetota bacterium]